MNTTLSCLLEHYFLNSITSIKFITQIIYALIKARDTNLTQLIPHIEHTTKAASCYRKLQRFFQNFRFDHTALVQLIIALAGIEAKAAWSLALDRTNWEYGKCDINMLVLSMCHNGIAIPIMWLMLDNNGGASNTADRQHLLDRFIAIFGVHKIKELLADREFIGDAWLKYLAKHSIPFYIRIKANLTIGRTEGELITANHLVQKLAVGEYLILNGKRHLGKNIAVQRCLLLLCATRKVVW